MTTSNKSYPFITKNQIRNRSRQNPRSSSSAPLSSNHVPVAEAACLAPVGKAWGWMSSERVVAD